MGPTLETGAIPLDECPGGMDLQLTLESGQTYHWRREDGRMYEGADPGWYYTAFDGEFVRVRQTDSALEWESTGDGAARLYRWLRLDDDLAAIRRAAPSDPVIAGAFRAHAGMRVVQDPPFACLISFICSTQMRVSRIHGMMRRLAAEYGTAVTIDGRRYHSIPTPESLANASEDDLRRLSLGYRAPYVKATAEMVENGALHPEAAIGRPYEEAREVLTGFVGVGDKVADCVLLFSLGYLEAVPLDTWIRSAIEEYFPECARDTYAETSRAIRTRFGDQYAGYVQTYVFHHLRTGAAASTSVDR